MRLIALFISIFFGLSGIAQRDTTHIPGKDTTRITVLDSVRIHAAAPTFGIIRLKDVDGAGIYAGKKSEVIILKDLTVNTATNNSRQIYSKIAGLNIYENDGGAGIQLAITQPPVTAGSRVDAALVQRLLDEVRTATRSEPS